MPRRRRLATALAFGVLTASVLAFTPLTDLAAADVGQCPPGTLPGPGSGNPIWSDDNVAVYAGGDLLTSDGAAEAEGLVVVAGDAAFDSAAPGTFNVGWVGVGSGVAPTPGAVMLAVGGDLTVGAQTILDVGANAVDAEAGLRGGSVHVGGVSLPDYEADGSRYRLNTGSLTHEMGSAALTPWAAWGPLLTSQSADFSASATTGTSTVAGAFLTFAGDGTSARQVFRVPVAVLTGGGSAPAIDFTGIPDGASVVIDVTGGGDVEWAPNYFADDGVRADDLASPIFGEVATRTLWNFGGAASVHLAGTSQVLGSILVPASGPATTLRVTASSNGRLYTNGSIVMDGDGNEHHNYPWRDSPFECVPQPIEPEVGQASITKQLSEADAALLPPETEFHGILTCTPPGDPGVLVREWDVLAGETVVIEDLPVGATCTATETLGAARGRAPLPGGPPGPRADPLGVFSWNAPVWDPAPPTFVVPPLDAPSQVSLTVANEIARGAFTISKTVSGTGAPTATFSGSWSCELPIGTVVMEGSWSLNASQTSSVIDAPVGSVCLVEEATPPSADGGRWGTPRITGSPVRITAGSAASPLRVVVDNPFVSVVQLVGFEIVKIVDNPASLAFDDEFSGTWQCTSRGTSIAEGTWSAGTTTSAVESGLPDGAVCTISENEPPDPANGAWENRPRPPR